jgi:hypothetical protein
MKPTPIRPGGTQTSIIGSGIPRTSNAVVLLLLVAFSAGCNQVFGLNQTQLFSSNAYECVVTCTSSTNSFPPINENTAVCLPSDLDPNINTMNTVTQTQLDNDCLSRVTGNIFGAVQQCVSKKVPIKCKGSAFPIATMFYAPECDSPCTGEDLASDCSNFNPFSNPPQKAATNIPGKDPVCLIASSDPPDPVPDPLAAGIFGEVSSCSITSGKVTITQGSDSQTQSATGVVNITGKPCPGESCQVGVSYRLNHINNFSFDSFAGVATVEFQHLFGSGVSIPAGATLDSSGNGNLPSSSTHGFGYGRRSNQAAGVEISSDTAAYSGTNSNPIGVGVDWHNHACELSGDLLGQLESTDTTVSADLPGTIMNEPPSANAGAPQTVQCTSAAGAGITLDGSGTTDPENNIALFVWRQGTRAGQEIGDAAKSQLNQGLGGTQTYFLKVVDTYAQSSESSTSVKVVDTTPPVITNVAATPNVLWPPNGKLVPVSVSVSDSDTCDPHPVCKIVQITNNEPITPADAQITGNFTANLSAQRLGTGTGRVYTLKVRCTDASGNSSSANTTISVPHDQGKGI